MKKLIKASAVICSLLLWCGLWFCQDTNSNATDPGAKKNTKLAYLSSPQNFFPTETGLRWVYDINRPSKNDPLHRVKVFWPVGNDRIISVFTREVLNRGPGQDGKYQLILRIEGPAPKQGTYNFENAIRVEIERDDLGIYEYSQGLFWLIRSDTQYQVTEMLLYDPNSPSSSIARGEGYWKQSPGISQRFKIFGAKPGTAIEYGDDNEKLLFVGPEKLDGQSCLHFRRIVKRDYSDTASTSYEDNYPSTPFTEDVWFAKDKGLVKLEQIVNDQITMIWKLVSFSRIN